MLAAISGACWQAAAASASEEQAASQAAACKLVQNCWQLWEQERGCCSISF
jgi:hypothetical protein